MYTIYFFVLIGIIIYVIYELRNGWDWDDLGLCGFLTFIGAVVGLVISFSLPATYTTVRWKVELVSLQDNGSVSGNFFLGCGQINGEMKYVFYTKDEDSTYRMWQVNYYDARVKYTVGGPKEEIIKESQTENFYNKFVLSVKPDEYSYIFEVPNGTIKTDFTLDSK